MVFGERTEQEKEKKKKLMLFSCFMVIPFRWICVHLGESPTEIGKE